MNTIEGIVRKERIRLYGFSDISALTDFPLEAYACSYIKEKTDVFLRIATHRKVSDEYLSLYGGKLIGFFSSVEVYGMGMRGSSDILCRIVNIIQKNKLRYEMTSACERGLLFIMSKADVDILYDEICREFRISFG
ncbi:MAG: hypothetical protein SOZ62_05385 [Eubacteriales bacterium]|nr:hypothetical protein [Eubacteriales bacterium]